MNVFIGCGSANVNDISPIYHEEVIKLASYLASNGYDLLCGGVDGLMGLVRETFLGYEKKVETIWVKDYWDDNMVNTQNSKLVAFVRDRKSYFLKNADLMVFVPGGVGTLDEIINAIEARRANEHNIPMILVNINNYYDNLIAFFQTMSKEKFGYDHPFEGKAQKEDILYFANDVDNAIKKIEELREKRCIRSKKR